MATSLNYQFPEHCQTQFTNIPAISLGLLLYHWEVVHCSASGTFFFIKVRQLSYWTQKDFVTERCHSFFFSDFFSLFFRLLALHNGSWLHPCRSLGALNAMVAGTQSTAALLPPCASHV